VSRPTFPLSFSSERRPDEARPDADALLPEERLSLLVLLLRLLLVRLPEPVLDLFIILNLNVNAFEK
jgi:hypothetical protein